VKWPAAKTQSIIQSVKSLETVADVSKTRGSADVLKPIQGESCHHPHSDRRSARGTTSYPRHKTRRISRPCLGNCIIAGRTEGAGSRAQLGARKGRRFPRFGFARLGMGFGRLVAEMVSGCLRLRACRSYSSFSWPGYSWASRRRDLVKYFGDGFLESHSVHDADGDHHHWRLTWWPTSPPVHKLIRWLASIPRTPRAAIAFVAFFSMATAMNQLGPQPDFSAESWCGKS